MDFFVAGDLGTAAAVTARGGVAVTAAAAAAGGDADGEEDAGAVEVTGIVLVVEFILMLLPACFAFCWFCLVVCLPPCVDDTPPAPRAACGTTPPAAGVTG